MIGRPFSSGGPIVGCSVQCLGTSYSCASHLMPLCRPLLLLLLLLSLLPVRWGGLVLSLLPLSLPPLSPPLLL